MKRTVKDFLKSVNYNVTFKSVEEFLSSKGCSVLFLGTPTGDAEIQKHSLEHMASTENAFTYCGQYKMVFINSALHANDKLLLLLHEVGHILLNHLGKNKHLTRDDIKAEMEANVFAYYVLNYKKPHPLLHALFPLGILLSLILSLSIAFGSEPAIEEPYREPAPAVYQNTEVSEETELPEESPLEDIVYVTKTGSKYHSEDCRHLHSSKLPVLRELAEEDYSPCSVCNP